MKHIENPNLPKGRVVLAAINSEAHDAIANLNSMGIKTINVNRCPDLPAPVQAHTDLQLLHLGGKSILTPREHSFIGDIADLFEIRKINSPLGNRYPEDVRLNCTLIGDKLICNPKTVAPEILEFAAETGLTVVSVNQGYARCSICVINENTIITDDKSVFTAAGKFLNDVLFISKGSIRLKGYDYGFIGGCCGKIDKDKIAFNGELSSHSDYKLILDFLHRNHIECIELKRGRLDDIGGIIPLCEE